MGDCSFNRGSLSNELRTPMASEVFAERRRRGLFCADSLQFRSVVQVCGVAPTVACSRHLRQQDGIPQFTFRSSTQPYVIGPPLRFSIFT